MITVSIVLLAIAELGGVVLESFRFRKRHLPLGLALAHGFYATACVLVLVAAAAIAATAVTRGNIALILFILAAMGGAVLFSYHVRKRPWPIFMVFGHGSLAGFAFILLVTHLVAG